MDLSKIDVYEFLSKLGLNNLRDERDEVWFSCFSDQHYRGDINPSASMQKGTTLFNCFSCGLSGNAITFLAQLENVSPIQAAIWIKEEFNIETVPKQENLVDNVIEILSKNKATKSSVDNLPILPEEEAGRRIVDWEQLWSDYNNFSNQLTELPGETWEDIFEKKDKNSPLFYMFDRGFSPKILIEWGIGWDKISERISIPIRDEDGNLVGFKGRAADQETNPRYLVLGGIEYGFDPYETKKVLFGLDKVLRSDNFKIEKQRMIVCEGELNALSMHQKGFSNTVGISGKILSSEQANKIKQFAREAILIFDEEDDAKMAAEKIRTSLPTYIVPSRDSDPAEMSRQELIDCLREKKSALL